MKNVKEFTFCHFKHKTEELPREEALVYVPFVVCRISGRLDNSILQTAYRAMEYVDNGLAKECTAGRYVIVCNCIYILCMYVCMYRRYVGVLIS